MRKKPASKITKLKLLVAIMDAGPEVSKGIERDLLNIIVLHARENQNWSTCIGYTRFAHDTRRSIHALKKASAKLRDKGLISIRTRYMKSNETYLNAERLIELGQMGAANRAKALGLSDLNAPVEFATWVSPFP